MEEERIQVLNNMEEVEQKIKELDNQVEESAREVKRRGAERDDDRQTQQQKCQLTVQC